MFVYKSHVSANAAQLSLPSKLDNMHQPLYTTPCTIGQTPSRKTLLLISCTLQIYKNDCTLCSVQSAHYSQHLIFAQPSVTHFCTLCTKLCAHRTNVAFRCKITHRIWRQCLVLFPSNYFSVGEIDDQTCHPIFRQFRRHLNVFSQFN